MDKKILQISPYTFEHLGGVEKHAGLLQTLFQQEMYTLAGGSDFPIVEPVKHCPLPCFRKKGFFSVFSNIRANNTELILSHIRFAPTAWFAFMLAKKRGIPYIHVEHGSNFLIHNNFFVTFISKIADLTIGKIIIKNADYVICVSQAGKDWVTQTFGRKKNISVIYRGFEFTEVKRIQNTIPRIGFVGRLTGYKNTDGLIRAVKMIEEKSWTLDIVGDGEEREKLENLVKKLSLEKRVHFLGAKDHEWIMNEFYPNIDIMVNSSFIECLGTTIIESLTRGCKVVATRLGGSSEIPGAFLVNPTDEGIMKGISHYLDNGFQDDINEKKTSLYEKFSLITMKTNFSKVFSLFQ